MIQPVIRTVLLATVFSLCHLSWATTDSARVVSRYFLTSRDSGTNDPTRFYTDHWRVWLQYHRAIEGDPSLLRQILQLPEDPYEGRKGARELLQSNLSTQSVRAQPTHVYILQLTDYKSPQALAKFIKEHWRKVGSRSIYRENQKAFRVDFSSEAECKWDPVFVLPKGEGKTQTRCLAYGIYASEADARQDAEQFKRSLGYTPTVMKQPLTTKLVHAFLYEPVLD